MRRKGFTLVELLITMAIIAILAGLLLGAMFSATETAKEAKTRSTIAKLHTLVMAKYESYKTRRVPIMVDANTSLDPTDPMFNRYLTIAAPCRLDALHELMRLEMPDRFSDIIDNPVTAIQFDKFGVPVGSIKIARPSVSSGYLRRLAPVFAAKGNPSATVPYKNHGAECLYMLVMYGLGEEDSPADQFGASEVNDTDKNGLPEFVDGWGTPIEFIRWPAGFASELQTQDPVKQPDPFDPRHVYPTAYALVPLIYSAGPDKIYDIQGNRDYDASPSPTAYSVKNNNPFDPVFITTGTAADNNGDLTGAGNLENNWADNTTNHLIGQR